MKYKCVRCHRQSNSGIWTTIMIPESNTGINREYRVCLHCRFKIVELIHGK